MMVVGRLRHPQGALPGNDRRHQHHPGRRLPRRGPARGHPADRAGARRGRRPARHRPGRDPAAELHRSRRLPADHRHRRLPTTRGSTPRRSTPPWPPPATTTCGPSRPAAGPPATAVQLGIGVSTYVEVTAPLGLHTEYGAVEIHDDGTASMAVGTSSHGQGHHTAFAMVASDVLGIPMDQDTAGQLRHRGRTSRRGHPRLTVAADCGQRRVRGFQGSAGASPAHRRPPARGQPGRHRRRRGRPVRGRGSRPARVVGGAGCGVAPTPPACPTTSSPARCATRATSTARAPPSRSVRTSRSSRWTPRPGR